MRGRDTAQLLFLNVYHLDCNPVSDSSSLKYCLTDRSGTMVINTDPSSQQHTIVIVCIVSPIISSIFVAIRLWTKSFITRSVGWDDCKLLCLCFLVASLTGVVDATLGTFVITFLYLT